MTLHELSKDNFCAINHGLVFQRSSRIKIWSSRWSTIGPI